MNWRKKSKKDWGRLDLNSNKSSKWAISDFVEIIGGGTPKTSISEYWNGSIPWLSVKDFGNDDRYVFETEKTITNEGLNNSSTKLLQKDDIIISARGTVGELAMLPFPMAFNQSCYGIRPKDDSIDKTFLYYLLRNSVQLLRKNTHGSVFDTITRDTFKGIEVEVPSIEEQVKIAGILSSLDDKIAENKKINHHLAEMAESIWKEKYANLKPNSTLGNFFPIITGKKDANVARGGQYPFFSCSQGISYTDAYSFEGNAILLAGNGDFNVKTYNGKFEAYQRTYVLIPNNEYRLGFLYYAIKHFLSDITAGDRGSVIKYITKGDIENLNLYMPDDESDFELFNQFVSNTAQNNAEIERLTETRDTLLPKLMSGELSVID